MTATVWINGRPDGQLDPADRGLAYGDGLFETMRLRQGRLPLWARHWQRLALGCQRLGFALDKAELEAELQRFLADQPAEGIIKLIVTRGAGGRGYLPPESPQPLRILSWHELPDYPAAYQEQGIAAGVCRQRLGHSSMLAGLKHLNRLEQVLLRRELQSLAAPEALAMDLDGLVIEGVFSNVFLVRGGQLYTPSLDLCGVSGVMRAELIEAAGALGISVTEAALTLDDFLAADEVFFCNSVYGLWPVRTLPGRDFAAPGPVSRQLQSRLAV